MFFKERFWRSCIRFGQSWYYCSLLSWRSTSGHENKCTWGMDQRPHSGTLVFHMRNLSWQNNYILKNCLYQFPLSKSFFNVLSLTSSLWRDQLMFSSSSWWFSRGICVHKRFLFCVCRLQNVQRLHPRFQHGIHVYMSKDIGRLHSRYLKGKIFCKKRMWESKWANFMEFNFANCQKLKRREKKWQL